MRVDTRQRLRLRLQSVSFYVLVLAVTGLGGWLSSRYDRQWDWSLRGSNTLSEASQKLLERIAGPVHITAYVRPASEARRAAIRDLVEKYRRIKPDIQLELVNPDERPQELRELGISLDGELLVRYQNRREHVQRTSESELSNALHRLLRQEQRWIVFLEGHGERDPAGQANFDLGDFGKVLQNKGLTVQTLNLAKSPTIPDNTSVLVLASPRTALLPGEITLLQEYLKRGGNLLLLTEPEAADGSAALLDLLAVKRLPGVIVDATTQLYGIRNPTFVLVPEYEPHPITRGLRAFTLFPQAAALEHSAAEKDDYRSDAIASTLQHAWTETGPLSGEIRYDENTQERAGPLVIGLALYRDRFAPEKTPKPQNADTQKAPQDSARHDGTSNGTPSGAAGSAEKPAEKASEKPSDAAPASPSSGQDSSSPASERKKIGEQRIVVFGDGDFLSNQYLANGANLDLGLAVLQWLAHDDQLLDIPARTTPDAVLNLGRAGAIAISVGFLLLLPLLLIVTGTVLWWQRRRR